MASARSPSRSTSDIVDTTPFLSGDGGGGGGGGIGSLSPSSSSSSSSSDDSGNSSGRRFVQRQSLRQAARFLRQASSRRGTMREPSMVVREAAAEHLEERQSDWAYSKPVVVLDVLWNFVFIAAAAAVLVLSRRESPDVPLRLWILGYAMQCGLHVACVCVEYRRRRRLRRGHGGGESPATVVAMAAVEQRSSGSSMGLVEDERNSSVAKHLESANTMFSFIWWIIGFYWVSAGGQPLAEASPQLYWLCIVFLGFDVFFVVFCVALACIIGIAVCCCLPCIIALLYAVADQEGATKEDIEQLSKFKFRRTGNSDKLSGDSQGPSGGTMTECGTDSPIEHDLLQEDAECCICLSAYEDGVELRQLPCGHHFHCSCIDKWLFINATCPLCKYNILKSSSFEV